MKFTIVKKGYESVSLDLSTRALTSKVFFRIQRPMLNSVSELLL